MEWIPRAVLMLSCVFAGFSAKAFDENQWNRLTEHIVKNGAPTEGVTGIYLSLSDIAELPNRDEGHSANYISTVGGYDSAGKYHFNRVEMVSETWRKMADNRWDIDQWLFAANGTGIVSFIRHVHMVQTHNGTVLVHESVPSTPEEDTRQWDLHLERWYQKVVQP